MAPCSPALQPSLKLAQQSMGPAPPLSPPGSSAGSAALTLGPSPVRQMMGTD